MDRDRIIRRLQQDPKKVVLALYHQIYNRSLSTTVT
jgi:hypothetical protein